MAHESANVKSSQPRLASGPLELRVGGATDEQLATGLTRARQVLYERGITAGRAFVCHSAVLAHEIDTSLPPPEEEVRRAARVCKAAWDAAILAAGGSADKGDSVGRHGQVPHHSAYLWIKPWSSTTTAV